MHLSTLWLRVFAIGFTALLALPRLRAEVVVLPNGEKTAWKYLDDGSSPEQTWMTGAFDDSRWKSGTAPLGYGDAGLSTQVSFGPAADAKHVTYYFRTSFASDQAANGQLEKFGIRLRRDDGAIVYLNGQEVIRGNMPAGPVNSATLASSALDATAETRYQLHVVPAALLAKEGANTVAVEVHQANRGSSDLFFDLAILGYRPGEVPQRDFHREGMEALASGNYETAAELLKQLEPDHPQYAKTMALLAHQIYGEALGRATDGLPYAKLAYEQSPQDRDVIRAYIKTHVLSGVLFDDKDIARERPKTIAKEYAFLVSKPDFGDTSLKFTRAQLEQDLDYLEHVLIKCFAYLELSDVDERAALDAIRLSLDDEMPVNSFELCIAKLISLFCDGHAGMQHGRSQFLPRGYAPYLAGTHQERIFLYHPDGSGFLDPDHPYVVAIDGKPIDAWLEAAGYIVVKKSKQWHRRLALENLVYVNYLRSELGIPSGNEITLKLESEDHGDSRELTVRRRNRVPADLGFPRGDSERRGDIGYLRIAQMTNSPQFLAELERWMVSFRDTQGLIIDVRGNSGGSKDILFTLFPYFMKPGAPMRVVELSTYRKPMELPKPNLTGFMMTDMSAQPVTSSRWKNDAERTLVREFIQNFQPEWKLPKVKFSDWHVLALDAATNPNAYYYDKPLIILQDCGSFSASDIFLGAFEDHPNTTLMGTASGGGNGWQESYVLPNTGLGLILCQSAKFRPSGKAYDGVGIEPDVVIEPTPQDIIGKTDTVLDAALERLGAVSREDATRTQTP